MKGGVRGTGGGDGVFKLLGGKEKKFLKWPKKEIVGRNGLRDAPEGVLRNEGQDRVF